MGLRCEDKLCYVDGMFVSKNFPPGMQMAIKDKGQTAMITAT